MINRDLYHKIKIDNAKNGTGVDTGGFSSIVFAIVSTAATKVTLIEGDTQEKLTEVSLEDYLGEPLDVKKGEGGLYKIGYRGIKRYVGVKIEGEGTAVAILGHPYSEPVK